MLRTNANARIDMEDSTWNYVDIAIFSTVEGNIGTICACLPVLAPFFWTMFGSCCLVTSESPSGQNNGSNYSSGSSGARARYSSKLNDYAESDHFWKVPHATVKHSQVELGHITVTRDVDIEGI